MRISTESSNCDILKSFIDLLDSRRFKAIQNFVFTVRCLLSNLAMTFLCLFYIPFIPFPFLLHVPAQTTHDRFHTQATHRSSCPALLPSLLGRLERQSFAIYRTNITERAWAPRTNVETKHAFQPVRMPAGKWDEVR